MKYNPKLDDFLEEHEDVTVMGLFWAGYWRLALIVMGVAILVALLTQ